MFEKYEKVKISGITNMWNVKLVCELTGLTREEWLKIMKNYAGFKNKYLKRKWGEIKWKNYWQYSCY